MMNTDVELGSGRTVEAVLALVELEEEAKAIVEQAETLEAGVGALLDAQRFKDAVSLLAHALPDREGVGWAWVCAREVTPEDSPDEIEAVLAATRAWIKEPTDEARRTAMAASEAAGLEGSAAYTGLAAFFCGETIGPAELDPVPPPAGVVSKVVGACIALAATEGPPDEIDATLERFAARGVELASRIHLWPDEESEAGESD